MLKKIFYILFLLIFTLLLITLSNKYKISQCYNNCADLHFAGLPNDWEYNSYQLDNQGDTIWTDITCYNEWCICIDECLPGLCCKLLN